MIRIRQIKLPLDENSKENLLTKVAHKLKLDKDKIKHLTINKLSLDARKEIEYVYEVDVEVPNEKKYLKDKSKNCVRVKNRWAFSLFLYYLFNYRF